MPFDFSSFVVQLCNYCPAVSVSVSMQSQLTSQRPRKQEGGRETSEGELDEQSGGWPEVGRRKTNCLATAVGGGEERRREQRRGGERGYGWCGKEGREDRERRGGGVITIEGWCARWKERRRKIWMMWKMEGGEMGKRDGKRERKKGRKNEKWWEESDNDRRVRKR